MSLSLNTYNQTQNLTFQFDRVDRASPQKNSHFSVWSNWLGQPSMAGDFFCKNHRFYHQKWPKFRRLNVMTADFFTVWPIYQQKPIYGWNISETPIFFWKFLPFNSSSPCFVFTAIKTRQNFIKILENFYPWYQATIVVSPRIVKSSLNKPMPQVHSRWEDDDFNLENEIGLKLKSRPLACSDLWSKTF